jgi:hypothetical protein
MTEPKNESPQVKSRAGGTLLACGLSAVIGTLALLTVTDLGAGSLRVPFGYGGGGVDAQLYQAPIKSLNDTGTHWVNPRMGAPGESNLYDHPMPEGLHFLTLWVFCRLTGDWAVAYNLFLLVHFPLGAVSGTWVLRRFGASVSGSVLGGVLFAYLPHHSVVMCSQHVFLGAYFPIPLALLVAVRLFEGQLSFLARDPHTRRLRMPFLSAQGLGAAVVCALLGSTGAYYAVFSCAFFAVAGFANLLRRRWSGVVPALLCVAVVVGTLAANMSPALSFRRDCGDNAELRRYHHESNYWALRVAEMVLPSAYHRHPQLAHVADKYNARFATTVTPEAALYVPLGMIGAFGLLAGLLAILRKDSDADGHQSAFTRLMLAAVLIAVPGGFGPLFNYTFTPWIRCYHRLCVFIGFLALATAVRLFDRAFPATSGKWRRRIGWMVAAVLLAFGLYDQTPRPLYPPYEERAAEFAADRAFVQSVESELPEGAAVFQLPYLPYPESGPVGEMYDYAHTRGYLHSDKLRWSYGAVKGRPTADWQKDVSELPPEAMLPAIAAKGFDAVWVDRWGYPNRTPPFEPDLAKLADDAPLVSHDGRYAVYKVVRFRRQWKEPAP